MSVARTIPRLFSKSGLRATPALSEDDSNLKMFEREDWTLFRTVDGLQQKAGVPAINLRRLVMKELADNAFDGGGKVEYGQVGGNRFFIEDNGPGFNGTPDEIAALFSIRRPMRSSKLLRRPQRGALGNGLRVVAGAVLASAGSLVVVTRNRRIALRPQMDGMTAVIKVTPTKRSRGTRIEIGFGPALPADLDPFAWVRSAAAVACAGKVYDGHTSAWWYDAAQFHELLLAYGARPVRGLVAELDGCTGGKAGEIVTAAGLGRMYGADISRQQATKLLKAVRQQTKPVSSERIGYVGRDAFPGYRYVVKHGTARLGSAEPLAEIPYVVEVWTKKTAREHGIDIAVLINRTPTTSDVRAWRDNAKCLCLTGSGLHHAIEAAPKKGAYDLRICITTPYCPITSDGKAPNLEPFRHELLDGVAEAMGKAQRAAPKDGRLSQKDVVLNNLDAVLAEVSGEGQYRFNQRQVLYRMRPLVKEQTGEELTTGNFNSIITDYEDGHGEIPGMYREPRGSISHPHRRDEIPLGTLTVESYQRPPWTFNKIVYIEKEGFSEALKDNGWPERHDCALMSSKGFSTRAARDLVDKIAEHDEPITVYCVHDADAAGTMIYETFQEATRARGARKVTIVNLGLEPWEAIALRLEVETAPTAAQRKAVAAYVRGRDDGARWLHWLQAHRVELNAMTTPEFIAWLDGKMAEHGIGKLVPPESVITAELERRLKSKISRGAHRTHPPRSRFGGPGRGDNGSGEAGARCQSHRRHPAPVRATSRSRMARSRRIRCRRTRLGCASPATEADEQIKLTSTLRQR